MENYSAIKEQNDTLNNLDDSENQNVLSGRSHMQKPHGKAKLQYQESAVAMGWSKRIEVTVKGVQDGCGSIV